jgi:DNA repair protein RadA
VLGHASTYRIWLKKGLAGKRIARLVDSPHLPEGEAVFKVVTEGVVD